MNDNESEKLEKAKVAKTKKIGIILLIVIGIPLMLIGACILILTTSGLQ